MNALRIVDIQVLKLIDYLTEEHQKTNKNLDLVTDYAFGMKLYPSNRYIISKMRGKEVKGGEEKHAPHQLIINLAKEYNIDYNYFYNDSTPAEHAFLDAQKVNTLAVPKNINLKENEKVFEMMIDDSIEPKILWIETEYEEIETEQNPDLIKELLKDLYEFKNLIKVLLISNYNSGNLKDKLLDVTPLFEKIILLTKKYAIQLGKNHKLEGKSTSLKSELDDLKSRLSESTKTIIDLNKDVAESIKMAYEAQRGQTETLKAMLELKD